MTEAVILVPRRAGIADRDALWEYTRAWWAERHPEVRIVEGDHTEGTLFNRSAAINRAAAKAGSWDVAAIIDADVLIDPDVVRRAFGSALETGRMTIPFNVRKDLSAKGTAVVMGGYRGSWERYVYRRFRDMVSAVVVVSRELWDATGGFDEAFVGWGWEDNAFAVMCETFGGPIDRWPGELWHLYHAPAPEAHTASPSQRSNKSRHGLYLAARGDADAVRALRSHETLEAAPAPVIPGGIPAILHRVVPEAVNPQAEAWWAEFETLHPSWTLKTWRDPIDPAAFPLTSPHWHRASTGAQLADLVRLEVLWNEGGIYVDQDMQPYRALDPLRPLAAFACWEDRTCVPNAVLGAIPQHPAIRQCIDLAIARMSLGVWEAGPGVTSEVFPHRDDVLLLPPGSFYPFHYRDAKRQRGRDHAAEQPWAFAAHHWWGSWLPKEKRW